MLGLTLVTALTLTATGCGDQSDGGASPGPSSATALTALTVTVRESPDSAPQSWTLTCDPAGGTHPDPVAACAALGGPEDPFKPVPTGMACTQQYGGPQTASVAGTYEGRPVSAAFSRTDGCEISRWDAVQHLLVVGGA